jgi:hypothetical protein
MSYAPDVLLAVYRHKDPGIMYHGQVAHQLPPSAVDILRPASDSQAPESIASTVRIPFPIGKFIEGRDRVRVKVKDILR